MKPVSMNQLSMAAVAMLALSSCVPPDQRNNPENAARLAPVPFVKLDKDIVVKRFESGEPQVTLYAGIYKPLRRAGRGTIYANESKKVHNAVAGRDQIGGFVWADNMSYPYGYCLFFYDTTSFSANWTERPTEALRHITR
jgi:hypothetical protein